MKADLHLLCAGAVQGLVAALQADFERASGCVLHGRFGAVGALREALREGAPCDVMVATHAMLVDLQANGDLPRGDVLPIGRVRTGLAIRHGESHPDTSTVDALRAALLAAPAFYFPDPQRATAGLHVASVLDRLGVRSAMTGRIRNFANGAASMRALADDGVAGALGCTQASEILATPGVDYAGPLRGEFELATVYSACLGPGTADPAGAQRLVDLMTGAEQAVLRERCGIGPEKDF
ncbi:MAG: substrate-binding domain-containing protein [Burkholderiaceae bacterium]